MPRLGVRLLVAALLTLAVPGPAPAAEITFMCAGALESWMKELIPQFEATSSHHLNVSFQAINIITERVRKGETADLATVSPEQWDSLQHDRKLDPKARVVVAKVAFGVFTRKDAAKPDVTSVDAFKRAFLGARSVGVFDPTLRGPTAIYVGDLFNRLGIVADLKPMPRPARTGPELFDAVANGDADIAIAQISEILAAPGVELIAPMPKEIQDYTIFTTVIPATAKQPEAAKTFSTFLTSAPARSLLAAKGLEAP